MIRKQLVKKTNQVKVTFALPQDHPHAQASVVGDFNAWDPTANPLKRRSNKTCSTSVVLDPDKRYAFRYVFRYDDGENWFNDEDADAFEPSVYGSENGVILT